MTARHLFIGPDSVRDAVLMQPVVARHQRDNPDASLDALASPAVAQVLSLMPQFADILMVGDDTLRSWRGITRVVEILRPRHYSLSFDLSDKLPVSVATWMARIPERHQLTGNRPDGGGAGLARFNAVTRSTEGGVDPTASPSVLPIPRLLAPADAEQAVRRLLDEHFAPPGNTGPILALMPGATDLTRRWPSRHFARLATMVRAQWPDARIVVAGESDDRVLGTEIRTLSQIDVLNLAGQLSLAQQLALMKQADVVVCNDADAVHLAATCARHLVAIYGATSPATDPPMAVNAQLLSLKLTCSPCGASACPLEHMNCLNLMEPVRVFNAIERVIQATDSSRPVQ